MMIFYRIKEESTGPRPMQVRRVRWLGLLSLLAYPVGCAVLVLGGEEASLAYLLAGYGTCLVALLAFAGVVSTGVQRIAAEERQHLDSLELDLRQKAYSRSFHIIGSALLLGVFYMILSGDLLGELPLWRPVTSEDWTGIMWGVVLLVSLTPTVVLAWTMPTEEIEPEAN